MENISFTTTALVGRLRRRTPHTRAISPWFPVTQYHPAQDGPYLFRFADRLEDYPPVTVHFRNNDWYVGEHVNASPLKNFYIPEVWAYGEWCGLAQPFNINPDKVIMPAWPWPVSPVSPTTRVEVDDHA